MTKSFKTLAPEFQGVIFVMLAYFCFSMLNVVSKLLYIGGMQPLTIVFFRSLCGILLFAPGFLLLSRRDRVARFNKVNLIKGVIDFLSTPVWILAVSYMSLAEAVTITYITPVITALLAVVFLKETFTRQKLLAMFVSLVGVVIVVNPKIGNFNVYACYALLTCFLWASANVLTKNLTVSQHPVIIVLFSNLVIFTLSLSWFVTDPYLPNWEEVALSMLMAVCASGGYVFLAYACKVTTISNLVPYDYFRMIFSSLLGYVFFGQLIGFNTVCGSLIVFASSMLLMHHTRKKVLKSK